LAGGDIEGFSDASPEHTHQMIGMRSNESGTVP
jgi:hypothetical protein